MSIKTVAHLRSTKVFAFTFVLSSYDTLSLVLFGLSLMCNIGFWSLATLANTLIQSVHSKTN